MLPEVGFGLPTLAAFLPIPAAPGLVAIQILGFWLGEVGCLVLVSDDHFWWFFLFFFCDQVACLVAKVSLLGDHFWLMVAVDGTPKKPGCFDLLHPLPEKNSGIIQADFWRLPLWISISCFGFVFRGIKFLSYLVPSVAATWDVVWSTVKPIFHRNSSCWPSFWERLATLTNIILKTLWLFQDVKTKLSKAEVFIRWCVTTILFGTGASDRCLYDLSLSLDRSAFEWWCFSSWPGSRSALWCLELDGDSGC